MLRFVTAYNSIEPPERIGFKVASSLIIHAIAISILVQGSLVWISDDLPEDSSVTTFMSASSFSPPPPPPAPPPASAAGTEGARRPSTTGLLDSKFTAPAAIPEDVGMEDDFGLVGFGAPGDAEGGVPGGVFGAVVGGLPVDSVEHEPLSPVWLDFRSETATPIKKK